MRTIDILLKKLKKRIFKNDQLILSKMEVYVELTYCMNGILFIMTYEMIS